MQYIYTASGTVMYFQLSMVASVWQLLFVLLIYIYFFYLFCISVFYISVTEEGEKLRRGLSANLWKFLSPNPQVFSCCLNLQTSGRGGDRGLMTELKWMMLSEAIFAVCFCSVGAKMYWMMNENPQPPRPFVLCHISPTVKYKLVSFPK